MEGEACQGRITCCVGTEVDETEMIVDDRFMVRWIDDSSQIDEIESV